MAVPFFQTLLDLPYLPKEMYLGVGALAGTFCREHRCHHTKNDGITAISQKLISKLQNCRPKNKVEEDNVSVIVFSSLNKTLEK